MQLNTIKPAAGSKKARRRVGRGMGSGLGKTAGRGHKGQKSRAGGFHKVGFEGGQMPLQRRLPKRGFKSALKKYAAEITLGELQRLDKDEVDLLTLKAAGLVRELVKTVKVIKSGELKRKVSLKGIGATVGAKAAIEAAGGRSKRRRRPSDGALANAAEPTGNRPWSPQQTNWPRAASSAICVAGWSSCCSRWWSTASVRTSRCRASTQASCTTSSTANPAAS